MTSASWGDTSTLTTGLIITGSGGSYAINGTHMYAEEGSYPVSFTVMDDGGNTALITGSITVGDANLAGSSGASGTGGIEGVTAATLGNATFSDLNMGALPTDFTVTSASWGDTSTLTTGLIITGSGGSYAINGTHMYAEEGTYPVSFTVMDDGGKTAVITGSITVGDANLAGSSGASGTGGIEGVTAATLGNATFSDLNMGAPPTDFTVTSASWGDTSTLTTGLIITGSGGSYAINGTHMYAEEGTYPVSFTVMDDGGKTAVITGSITVGDANLAGSSGASGTGGVEGVTAATLSNATFGDLNAGAPPTDFTVTSASWGDTSTLTTGLIITGSGGSYAINGTHMYAEEGTYPVSFTVMDDGGKTAVITGSITVGDANLAGSSGASGTGGVEGVTAATLSNATFGDLNAGARRPISR